MAGQTCDMQEIYELSQQYGFRILEDASHAIGANYKDELVGSCAYSDITIFSFHPVKIITSCEGGMAITNNLKLAKKIRLLSSHGISSNKDINETNTFFHGDLVSRPLEEIWNYQQIYLGFNYRLSDVHASIGLSQFKAVTRPARIKQKLKYEAGLYSKTVRVVRNTSKGIFPSFLGLFRKIK